MRLSSTEDKIHRWNIILCNAYYKVLKIIYYNIIITYYFYNKMSVPTINKLPNNISSSYKYNNILNML